MNKVIVIGNNKNLSLHIIRKLEEMGYMWQYGFKPSSSATAIILMDNFIMTYWQGEYFSIPSNYNIVDTIYDARNMDEIIWASILSKKIPEYTMEEAIAKMGHEFKIKK